MLVGHRKKAPPVQVTVATTTCVSRVSALVGHRKRPPVQVTVAPAPFAPPHVPESICTQWLKKKTTSASYSRSEPAPPPLECTLQQANVSLPKGMPLNWGAWEEIQWHALRQVTFASSPPSVKTERAGLVEYIIHLTYVGHFETN